MKPSSEGLRLKALREATGATQDLIAELAGISRVTVVRAETNKVKWRSSELREGLMRAYSMSYEQLAAYLGGTMPLREALEICSPKIELAIKRGVAGKAREHKLDDVFRRASMQEDLLQATRDAAAVVYEELDDDVPISAMVQHVLRLDQAIRTHIADTVRSLKSDRRAP